MTKAETAHTVQSFSICGNRINCLKKKEDELCPWCESPQAQPPFFHDSSRTVSEEGGERKDGGGESKGRCGWGWGGSVGVGVCGGRGVRKVVWGSVPLDVISEVLHALGGVVASRIII